MINLGILNDKFSYILLNQLFKQHSVAYVTDITFAERKNKNTVNIFNSTVEHCDILFCPNKNLQVLPTADFYVLPISNITSKNKISFGFSAKHNVTYSSIMQYGENNRLLVSIQNPFKTYFNTKLVKYEFFITTDIFDLELLDKMLGCITVCLYLDIRFAKDESIFLTKGDKIYVQ